MMRPYASILFAPLFAFLLTPHHSLAQCDDNSPSGWGYQVPEEGFAIDRFFKNTVTPRIVTETRIIRSFIRDERFARLMQRCGDIRATDAIYIKALVLTEFNTGRALFLSLLAVLDHQSIRVKMPVIGALTVPMTLEEDEAFSKRSEQLPRRLYPDTPRNPSGDRDKLQHFFASAYLEYIGEAAKITDAVGNAVEAAEAQVIIGGANDERDKRANRQGAAFGRGLLSDRTRLPSDYLIPATNELR